MASRTEQMVARLKDLQAGTADIEASAVVSVDGLIMASSLPADVEEDRVSAMSAAMLSLGERIASELGRGTLDQVYIRGDNGYVVLMSVGEEAVLTALARSEAKLGLIFLDMKRAAEDLTKFVWKLDEWQKRPSAWCISLMGVFFVRPAWSSNRMNKEQTYMKFK
jgi:predicted regulator of Ras-like GTPase activity (Roadblock/LC7/MglB family)